MLALKCPLLGAPVSSYHCEQPVSCPGGLSVSREAGEQRNSPFRKENWCDSIRSPTNNSPDSICCHVALLSTGSLGSSCLCSVSYSPVRWSRYIAPNKSRCPSLSTVCRRINKISEPFLLRHVQSSYLHVLSDAVLGSHTPPVPDKFCRHVSFHNKYFRLTATRVLSVHCGFGVCSALQFLQGILENCVTWNKGGKKIFS